MPVRWGQEEAESNVSVIVECSRPDTFSDNGIVVEKTYLLGRFHLGDSARLIKRYFRLLKSNAAVYNRAHFLSPFDVNCRLPSFYSKQNLFEFEWLIIPLANVTRCVNSLLCFVKLILLVVIGSLR